MAIRMTIIASKIIIFYSLLTIIFIISQSQKSLAFIYISCIEGVNFLPLIDGIDHFENLRAYKFVISIDSVYNLAQAAILMSCIIKIVKRFISPYTLYHHKFFRRSVDYTQIWCNFSARLIAWCIIHNYHLIIWVFLL